MYKNCKNIIKRLLMTSKLRLVDSSSVDQATLAV